MISLPSKNRGVSEQQHLTSYGCLLVPLDGIGAGWVARPTLYPRMIWQRWGQSPSGTFLTPWVLSCWKQLCLKRLRLSAELFLLFARVGASARHPNHSFCSHYWYRTAACSGPLGWTIQQGIKMQFLWARILEGGYDNRCQWSQRTLLEHFLGARLRSQCYAYINSYKPHRTNPREKKKPNSSGDRWTESGRVEIWSQAFWLRSRLSLLCPLPLSLDWEKGV